MTLLPGWNVRVGLCGFFFCGLGLALTTGCGDPAPVTAKNSQFQVAGDDDKQPAEKGQAEKGNQPGAAEKSQIKKPTPRTTDDPGDPGEGGPAKTGEPAEVVDDNADYGASEKYPLPPGGPENLMGFLRNLTNKKPKGATKAEQQEDFVAIQDSRLAVARKLMTYPGIPRETKSGLLQLMMEIHQDFLTNKLPGAEERLEAFARELTENKDPEIAALGRVQTLDITLNKLASQTPPPADGKEVAAEIEKFVAESEGSPIAFIAALEKCVSLQRVDGATKQFQLDLVDELKKVATRYKSHALKDVSSQADEILKNIGFLEAQVEVNVAIKELAESKEGAEDNFVAAVKLVLEKDKAGELALQLLSKKAIDLEFSDGKLSAVGKLHDLLEARFKDHEDKELAKFVTERAESARKRIGMVGKPLVVEGVTLDGKPFDFAPYQGKYVLVDFWGTWCEPCLKELPNVHKNYKGYHAKGFEVIGIALEEKLERLERFFSLQTLPWQTVISQELFEKKEVEDRMSHPVAVANGIQILPFVVLLDKEGKVDSLHLRGSKLEARLKELLGDPEPVAEEKTEKPADTKEGKPAEEKGKKPADEKPAAEEKPTEKSAEAKKEGGGCGVAVEEEKKDEKAEEVNPYSAKPGLSTDKLVVYIEKMLDKPKTIQSRPGFAEAVVEACDRVLAANPAAKDSETLAAAEAKFETLHKKACTGDETSDKALTAFTEQMKADTRERIARQVAFFQMERKVIDGAELPADKIPDLLKELKDYFAAQKLTSKHLRMASSTVALINKLESGDEREKLFGEFGGLFAKASDKELARYGKKLAQKPEAEESDLVGKDLELAGTTAAGNGFKWEGYRGKVVLVDFWATWCSPCKREMPHVKELHEKLAEKGFAVVGVSLDKDQEALQAYLMENQIPWENLAGDETQELAEKYGVRGIPTMMAIGKDGKILGVSHNVASLVPIIEKALEK